jgi:hypothetical protein
LAQDGCLTTDPEQSMAKEQRTMKAAKKAPAKTMMEKRAAKAAKRASK